MDSYDVPESENHFNFNRTNLAQDCDSHYRRNLNYDNLDQCFTEANLKNPNNDEAHHNLIYYSTDVDHYNHGYSKEHPKTFIATHSVEEGWKLNK